MLAFQPHKFQAFVRPAQRRILVDLFLGSDTVGKIVLVQLFQRHFRCDAPYLDDFRTGPEAYHSKAHVQTLAFGEQLLPVQPGKESHSVRQLLAPRL